MPSIPHTYSYLVRLEGTVIPAATGQAVLGGALLAVCSAGARGGIFYQVLDLQRFIIIAIIIMDIIIIIIIIIMGIIIIAIIISINNNNIVIIISTHMSSQFAPIYSCRRCPPLHVLADSHRCTPKRYVDPASCERT